MIVRKGIRAGELGYVTGRKIQKQDIASEFFYKCETFFVMYYIIHEFRYDCVKSLLKLLLWLISIAVLCWSVLWYWGDMSSPERIISRRLANFPFVLWQVSFDEFPMQCKLKVHEQDLIGSPLRIVAFTLLL